LHLFGFNRQAASLTDAEIEEIRSRILSRLPVAADKAAPTLVDLFAMMGEGQSISGRSFSAACGEPDEHSTS